MTNPSCIARLENKAALVVGAGASGDGLSNGAACAVKFAAHGAQVICADKSLDAAEATAEQIRRAGGRATALRVDVADPEDIAHLVRQSLDALGRIDILHNNVGIQDVCDFQDISVSSWDFVHAVNLRGAMLTIQAVMPSMTERRSGSIINMSSTASKHWTNTQYLSYSTSKAALNHMTRVLARQFAPSQVRCNAILGGLIETPHAARLARMAGQANAADERAARSPMKRQATPEDIANAALFLASDESAYITGQELAVDGGLLL